jgi:putative aldouronate transport system permease protein
MVQAKLTGSDLIFSIFVYTMAVLGLILILYPLYFVVIASISEPTAVTAGRVWLMPIGFTLDGYAALLQEQTIWVSYANTIFYTIAGTFIHLAVNLPAAYALSRSDLLYRNQIMVYFLIIMFFSGGLIPTFLTIRDFGMLDTRLVMILPFTVSVFNIIVARTFFQSSLPLELWEAARIDGCGNIQYFIQIALPLSKPIIAVIALWFAVGQWNSFFTALVYLQREELMPLQIILRRILIQHVQMAAQGTGEALVIAMRRANLIRYSAIIVSTLPIMCFYPFVQKHFNQGVMIGALKG